MMTTQDLKELTEEQLILLLKKRDDAAFSYLYNNYSANLFSVISSIIPDREMAGDVLQEAFINIYRKIDSYNLKQSRLYTWIINIARNEAIDTIRSREFKRFTFDAVVEFEELIKDDKQSVKTLIASQLSSLDSRIKGFHYLKLENAIPDFEQNDLVSLKQEGNKGYLGRLIVDKELPESRLTPLEKMDIAVKGISKRKLERLKNRTGLDYDKLGNMLATTKVTLINKKGDERYSTALSEKILSIADIYSYGYEVFEDEKRFNNWMLSPIRALGGKAPYEVMSNQFGREEVKNIIGRIEYGVYS